MRRFDHFVKLTTDVEQVTYEKHDVAELIMATTAALSQWNMILLACRLVDHTVMAMVNANSSLKVIERRLGIPTDSNVP